MSALPPMVYPSLEMSSDMARKPEARRAELTFAWSYGSQLEGQSASRSNEMARS
jgi:hypothetical protein